MFKKTLLAAAIMATVSAPAFAKVVINDTATFTTTTLAAVTKQPVLNFSTAQQDVSVTFSQIGDLKQNGFITLELSNGATFNAAEVRNWLTFTTVGAADANIDVVGQELALGVVGIATTNATVLDMFRSETIDTTKSVIAHAIDQDGKRLRLALNDAPGTTLGNITDVLTNAAGDKIFSAGTNVDFNLTTANQIFNLKSGSNVSIDLKVGALRNASYTADPVATPALFKLGDLFELAKNDITKATALVADRFAQLNVGQANVAADNLVLVNKTTNQNIQLDKVNLSIAGDFSGFNINPAGELLDAANAGTGWVVADGQATKVAGNTVLEGNTALTANEAIEFVLSVLADNEQAIEAQSFTIKANIQGTAQDTFEDFADELAEIVVINRDGMKFDTITTGTSASNQIFVRDISKILPETGGKIFVTITEYADHGVNGRGEGTVLVDRAVLSTTLPSGGAVTLNPTEVAKEVNAQVTAGRQARFVFEVETNRGEVAVKKSNSEGVDIQNGTKGVETLVDFTL